MGSLTTFDDNNNTLNFRTAAALIELFDVCYKQGVVHAFQVDDDNEAKMFIEESRKPEYYATLCSTDIFGRIKSGTTFNFKQWRHNLSFWAQNAAKRALIEWYLDRTITTHTYAGVAYELCMDFYLQGIYHYTLHPMTQGALDRFLAVRNATLVAPTGKQRVKSERKTDDWMRDVQLLCFERSKLESTRPTGQKRIKESMYDNFAKIFWRCIQGRHMVMKERAKQRKIVRDAKKD